MENQSNEFIDADAFFTKNGFSFQQIILEYLRKISTLAGAEWRGGYYNEKSALVGSVITTSKEYIPDAREMLGNSIYFLDLLLCPHYDKAMQDKETEIIKEIEAEKDKDKLLMLRLKLFREMSYFLKRKGYLEAIKGAE